MHLPLLKQRPCCMQFFGQTRRLHVLPAKPFIQKHVWFLHTPPFLHNGSQTSISHNAPVHFESHSHLCLPLFPLIQVPWLLQFFSHLQKKTSHASPAYPSEHLQKPVFWQRPCPEHCFGHAFKTHDTPTNPWLHVHLPVPLPYSLRIIMIPYFVQLYLRKAF